MKIIINNYDMFTKKEIVEQITDFMEQQTTTDSEKESGTIIIDNQLEIIVKVDKYDEVEELTFNILKK